MPTEWKLKDYLSRGQATQTAVDEKTKKPTWDELLACVLAFVRDCEQLAYISHESSARGWDWQEEWKRQDKCGFDLVQRARALLNRAGISVQLPGAKRRKKTR